MSDKHSLMRARLEKANALMLWVMGLSFLFSLYLASWYGMWSQALGFGLVLVALAALLHFTLAATHQQHQLAQSIADGPNEMRSRQQQIDTAIQALAALTRQIGEQAQNMTRQLGMLYLPRLRN